MTAITVARRGLKEVDPVKRFLVIGVVGLIAAIALAVAPSKADTATKNDGNDTIGFLDIEEVQHNHGANDKLVHKVITFDNWASSQLTGGNYIELDFDLPSDDSGRMIEIKYQGGELKAKMYQIDPPRYLRTIDVSRPSEHAVKVRFKKSELKSGIDSYKWRVRTVYDGSECPTTVCVDTRPNKANNWISHNGL